MALKEEMRVIGLIVANLNKLPPHRRKAVLDFVADSVAADPGPTQVDERQESLFEEEPQQDG